MELLNILSVLARHRVLVGVGAILSALAGLMALYHVSLAPPGLEARSSTLGTASARLVLDAPDTVSAEAYPDVEYTLAMRAILLSDSLAEDDVRTGIARRSGVPERDLVVNGPSAGTPPAKSPLSERIAFNERAPAAPYVVTVRTDGQVPFVGIDVVAPDAAGAKRVAAASADALQALPAERIGPGRSSIVVQQLGDVDAETIVDAPSRAIALIVAVVTMGAWCIGLVLIASVRRTRRAARLAQPAV